MTNTLWKFTSWIYTILLASPLLHFPAVRLWGLTTAYTALLLKIVARREELCFSLVTTREYFYNTFLFKILNLKPGSQVSSSDVLVTLWPCISVYVSIYNLHINVLLVLICKGPTPTVCTPCWATSGWFHQGRATQRSSSQKSTALLH